MINFILKYNIVIKHFFRIFIVINGLLSLNNIDAYQCFISKPLQSPGMQIDGTQHRMGSALYITETVTKQGPAGYR